MAEIQRIERMIRDNNYSEEEEHEKTEELKRLYHSTMLDSNRKQSDIEYQKLYLILGVVIYIKINVKSKGI